MSQKLRRVGTQTRFPTLRCGNGSHVPVTHHNDRFGVLIHVSQQRSAPRALLTYQVWNLDSGATELWGHDWFWDVPSFVRAARLALGLCKGVAERP